MGGGGLARHVIGMSLVGGTSNHSATGARTEVHTLITRIAGQEGNSATKTIKSAGDACRDSEPQPRQRTEIRNSTASTDLAWYDDALHFGAVTNLDLRSSSRTATNELTEEGQKTLETGVTARGETHEVEARLLTLWNR